MFLKENIKKSLPGMLLIAAIFFASAIVSLFLGIPISKITGNFNYSVIVILITMELFTNLVVETGIMQFLATKMAVLSKGNKRTCMLLFGLLMFLISAFLNNITAVLIILPVLFVLIKALDVDKNYIATFFAVILALSNTGGASSPIGDFPAIVIMTSGITTFTGYLFRAFPLFLFTSIILLAFWLMKVKDKETSKNAKLLAVDLLHSRYKNLRVRYDVLIPLCVIMVLMFIAWSIVPQNIVPPEIIAILGYCASIIVASLKGVRIRQSVDMKSVLTISSFLFLATVISETGFLSKIALVFEESIPNPKLLLIVIMLMTSMISGLVSAGPAATAMMPLIVKLCNTTLASHSGWVAIAYAASICAGSSLFLWSATAGFILSGKINSAEIECNGRKQTWGVKDYLKYGLINYVIQMSIAVVCIMVII